MHVQRHDLRPYQVAAIEAVEREWDEGRRRTMIALATGLGKTTIFAEIVRRSHAATRKRSLVLAHRIELIEQAAARLESVGCPVEIESGDAKASMLGSMFGGAAVVATVQTLRGRRLERWPRDSFDKIIVDECHHASAANYQAIMDHFAHAKVLGVTATPDRGDGVALGGVAFDSTAFALTILDGVRAGYLCDVRRGVVDLACVSLDSVRTTKQEHGRDLSAEDVARAMEGREPMHAIAAPLAERAGDRKTLVFMPSVETAHHLAEVLAGYVGAHRVRSLDGKTDKDTRARVIAEYRDGDVQFLVNCALFTEGFDAPATACVAIARPTKSRALYAQMVGRGTRLAPGKADCLVLDFFPVNTRHDLASIVDIFDGDDAPEMRKLIAGEIAAGETVLAARAKAAERSAEDQRKREASLARAAEIKLRALARYDYAERPLWTTDAVCGVSPTAYDSSVPLASAEQLRRLEAMRVPIADRETKRSAADKLAEATKRRRLGLCTIRQAQTLIRAGLRGDVTFEVARTIMDKLATSRWKPTPEMTAQYGLAGAR